MRDTPATDDRLQDTPSSGGSSHQRMVGGIVMPCLRHGALFCGPCEVMDAPRCRHGGLWKMCSLCYPPESGEENSPNEKLCDGAEKTP